MPSYLKRTVASEEPSLTGAPLPAVLCRISDHFGDGRSAYSDAVCGPVGLEPATYGLKDDRAERCADEGKRWSALSVASKSVAARPQDQHVVRPITSGPGPCLVLVHMSQTGRHLEPRSTVRSRTTSSIHYTRANVLIELCVCRRGGPQDALANDLGEHGDSMSSTWCSGHATRRSESGIRSTTKRSLP
jgi:hypothetical protein